MSDMKNADDEPKYHLVIVGANEGIRHICEVHGDIGSKGNSTTIVFSFWPEPETLFCPRCLRDLLLTKLTPVSEKDGE